TEPAPAPVAPAPVVEAARGHLLQQRVVPRRQVAAARWVALAGERRFDEAYGLLQKVPLRELDDPDDLLLAADVARQAGRPAEAVPFLERVVKDHPRQTCAQLAGFSLGKVYLDSLDQPALAAKAFAGVRQAAPKGGLAQDALAREVEAWSRAGDAARAHATALEYVSLYPDGRRVAAVRVLGKL
ncbi:MAG TPA: tetratricopeptide repeat protein, partial [Polyangia bacterium]|nr:tetratricopeptide repeat protein [Polyangia bacterium]